MEHLCEGAFGDVLGKDSTQRRQIPKEPEKVSIKNYEFNLSNNLCTYL